MKQELPVLTRAEAQQAIAREPEAPYEFREAPDGVFLVLRQGGDEDRITAVARIVDKAVN